MECTIKLIHSFASDNSVDKPTLTAILHALTVIAKTQEKIMTQFDDMKAQATELRKDVTRVIASNGELRQGLADANAKIDQLLKSDNLSAASQQTLNEAQAILVDADNQAEAAVPEAPPPSPPVESTPPEVIPPPVEPTPDAPPSDTPV